MALADAADTSEPNDVKDYWYERPDDKTVQEFLEYIDETGRPRKWWGHTNTPAPENAAVEFLAKVRLRKEFRKKEYKIHCPICVQDEKFYGTDTDPAFIVWYKEEGTIRVVGSYCFRDRYPEIFEEAMERYDAEEKRKRRIDFVVSSLPLKSQLFLVCEQMFPIAKSVDETHSNIHKSIKNIAHFNLYNYSKNGELLCESSEGQSSKAQLVTFKVISGYKLLNPKAAPRLSKLIIKAEEHLRKLPRYKTVPKDIGAVELENIYTHLKEARKIADKVRKEIFHYQSFFGVETISILKNWAAHPGCPIPQLCIDFKDNIFTIGRFERIARKISIPVLLFEYPLEVPEFTGR